MEEKIRYEAGLGEQIASTIRKIDGVLDADVQLSFPEEDPLNPDKFRGDVKASVYVKHTGVLDDPNAQLITKIRRLVASAIQGLDFDNVTVIPDRARYADISLREALSQREADKQFIKVWTLIVAKESVTRFRIVFLSMIVLVFLLLVLFGWTIWKASHIIAEKGGMREFFSPHQWALEEKPKEKEEKGEEESKEEEKSEEEDDEEGVT
jgi:type III secretion protein J